LNSSLSRALIRPYRRCAQSQCPEPLSHNPATGPKDLKWCRNDQRLARRPSSTPSNLTRCRPPSNAIPRKVYRAPCNCQACILLHMTGKRRVALAGDYDPAVIAHQTFHGRCDRFPPAAAGRTVILIGESGDLTPASPSVRCSARHQISCARHCLTCNGRCQKSAGRTRDGQTCQRWTTQFLRSRSDHVHRGNICR
jgi:hypothetical protein